MASWSGLVRPFSTNPKARKMTDAQTLIIPSSIHGERLWRRVAERPYTTRDGRSTVLLVWQSTCVICGKPFEITTPSGVKAVKQSASFGMTTCPEHRLTPAEVGKLGVAKKDKRRAVFEALKRRKLKAAPLPSSNAQHQPQGLHRRCR